MIPKEAGTKMAKSSTTRKGFRPEQFFSRMKDSERSKSFFEFQGLSTSLDLFGRIPINFLPLSKRGWLLVFVNRRGEKAPRRRCAVAPGFILVLVSGKPITR
mmetsp:Transcript_9139/g.22918  ORF Transcript_9139/g.22918 Transcript_9139/m.22918 type:complete len:102 (+) Transcript_9139:2277-2582(+)